MKFIDPRSAGALALILAGLGLAAPAHAAPLLNTFGGPNGYGTDHLPPNDDGSSSAIDITSAFPGGLNFFGTTHTQVYVNTNGNITFSGSLFTFTPDPFPVASRPMIAPYWGDVDIRGGGYPSRNEVAWVLRPGQMIVTWHNVGYYNTHDDKVMDFQLIISNSMSCGAGDFEVEFRFNTCAWETGDASSGSGGFGGTQAQSGFDAGNDRDFVEIAGSRMAGISTLLCTTSNVAMPGIWQFSVRSGAIMCPGAGEPCDTGMAGVCAAGITQCLADTISCVGARSPGTEVCDGLDNDCDGMIDDGDLCASPNVCNSGACVPPCFEGGCGEGEICTASGFCADAACADVSCPTGERCVDGTCQGACVGVVCPHGQQCLGGGCIDACDILTCSEGSICTDGACNCPCPGRACEAGETCGADGACISSGCDLTICDAGFYCEAGACLDACAGATCPSGEVCEVGACVPAPMSTMPDGGVPMGDGGVGFDSGPGTIDSGLADAGSGDSAAADADDVDSSRTVPGAANPGCGCRVAGPPTSGGAWALLMLLGAATFLRRRRR